MTGTDAMTLAMHPEAVAGDPSTLRWVVPAGRTPFIGPVGCAPGLLGELLAGGSLETVTCSREAVETTLGPGLSWRQSGERVRQALREALAEPDLWVPAVAPEQASTGQDEIASVPAPTATGDDATLEASVRAALAGPAGDYVRSHGGRVHLVGVRDGVASVRLSGACGGCPASALTIHGRLERDLRAQFPGLRTVEAAPGALNRLLSALRPGT